MTDGWDVEGIEGSEGDSFRFLGHHVKKYNRLKKFVEGLVADGAIFGYRVQITNVP